MRRAALPGAPLASLTTRHSHGSWLRRLRRAPVSTSQKRKHARQWVAQQNPDDTLALDAPLGSPPAAVGGPSRRRRQATANGRNVMHPRSSVATRPLYTSRGSSSPALLFPAIAWRLSKAPLQLITHCRHGLRKPKICCGGHGHRLSSSQPPHARHGSLTRALATTAQAHTRNNKSRQLSVRSNKLFRRLLCWSSREIHKMASAFVRPSSPPSLPPP